MSKWGLRSLKKKSAVETDLYRCYFFVIVLSITSETTRNFTMLSIIKQIIALRNLIRFNESDEETEELETSLFNSLLL